MASFDFVQKVGESDTSGTINTRSVTVPAGGVAQGNTILLGFAYGKTATGGITSVTDSAGNTYTQVVASVGHASVDWTSAIWMANVTTALASGDSITFTIGAGGQNIERICLAYEYEGTLTADKTASASGTSNSPSSGSTATTASANELLFSALALWDGPTATAGAGFTARAHTSVFGACEDRKVTATGAYAGTWSLSASDEWIACIATFSGGDGGGGTPPVETLAALGVG